MTGEDRPVVPTVDADTQMFWEAARERRLVLQRCESGHWQFPPRVRCHLCWKEVTWEQAEGRGSVYSFSVVHRAPVGFVDRAPYVVVLVRLVEGVQMVANLLNCAPGTVKVGLSVAVCFEELGEGTVLPQFEPSQN